MTLYVTTRATCQSQNWKRKGWNKVISTKNNVRPTRYPGISTSDSLGQRGSERMQQPTHRRWRGICDLSSPVQFSGRECHPDCLWYSSILNILSQGSYSNIVTFPVFLWNKDDTIHLTHNTSGASPCWQNWHTENLWEKQIFIFCTTSMQWSWMGTVLLS